MEQLPPGEELDPKGKDEMHRDMQEQEYDKEIDNLDKIDRGEVYEEEPKDPQKLYCNRPP